MAVVWVEMLVALKEGLMAGDSVDTKVVLLVDTWVQKSVEYLVRPRVVMKAVQLADQTVELLVASTVAHLAWKKVVWKAALLAALSAGWMADLLVDLMA